MTSGTWGQECLDHNHQYPKSWQCTFLPPSEKSLLSGYDSVSYESDQCESVKRPAMDAATNEVSEPTKPDAKSRHWHSQRLTWNSLLFSSLPSSPRDQGKWPTVVEQDGSWILKGEWKELQRDPLQSKEAEHLPTNTIHFLVSCSQAISINRELKLISVLLENATVIIDT